MWSALCAALLVCAAIPHAHGGQHADQNSGEHAVHAANPAPAGDLPAGRVASADGVLVPDDAHESHSPSLAFDAHPCTLCRDKSTHDLAAVHSEPLRLEVCERSPCAPISFARRPELLLAQHHPARAPPRA